MGALLLTILTFVALIWLFALNRRIKNLTFWVDDLNRKISRLAAQLEKAPPTESMEKAKVPETAETAEEPEPETAVIPPSAVEPEWTRPLTPPPIPAMSVARETEPSGIASHDVRDIAEEATPAGSPAADIQPEPAEAKLGFEARVGQVWALRIGLLLLAIGIAYFARLITTMLGPGAKVALAYAGTLVLFAVGKVFERKLQNFARPVMAGALSLAFFVSFSSYFIPPMRCLPMAGTLAWMLVGVFVILAMSERWKSQPTAGLAIFLGHVSAFVAAGDADAFSLVVIAFLSATAVLLFLRHDWLPLSIFAVAAAYFTHALWISVAHVETTPERAFWINLAFLSSYYLIFQASDLIWWRRKCRRAEDAFSSLQVTTGRILGPTNLVLYVAMVSFIYVGTKVYLPEIHWFFFALAALQAVLGIIHRSFGNRDYVFYPAVGVILVTMGFFSAFEALTLNIVLASEALVLLIAAHRTRVWVFHLLAQAMMAVNFVHYWVYTSGQESTLAYFIGGLMTAAVYFVKASFEEIWYGGEARLEWQESGTRGSISKWLAERFDSVYSPIAPYLAHAHAAGGAVILTNQCAKYFKAPDAVLALSILVLVLAFLGLLRRSIPLLTGFLFLQGGVFVFLLTVFLGNSQISAVLEWWVAAAGLIACAGAATCARWRFSDAGKSIRSLFATQLALWVSMSVVFTCLILGREQNSLYLAWVAAITLIYIHQDLSAVGLKALGEEVGAFDAAFSVARMFTCLAAAVLVAIASRSHVGHEIALPVWLAVWAGVIVMAAGIRRNLSFYLSGFLVLLACYFFLLDRRFAIRVMDNTAAALSIVIITIGIAWVQDYLLSTRASLSRGMIAAAEGFTYVPYALGLLFLTTFFYHRISFPWSIVWVSACSIGLYIATGPLGMRRGALASFCLILLAHLIGFVRFAQLHEMPRWMFVPAIILFASAIAYERILTLAGGLEFEVRYQRTVKNDGRTESQAAHENITPAARSVLIVAATAVIMMAIYHSGLLGIKWTTAGWSLVGAVLIALGFAWRTASYRRTALAVFAVCLVRVFLVDTRHLADTYRTLAFITLGICFLIMAWLYSRFASDIRKWL